MISLARMAEFYRKSTRGASERISAGAVQGSAPRQADFSQQQTHCLFRHPLPHFPHPRNLPPPASQPHRGSVFQGFAAAYPRSPPPSVPNGVVKEPDSSLKKRYGSERAITIEA